MCLFFNDTATTEIYTLSLHDALPISERLAATDDAAQRGALLAQVGLLEKDLQHRGHEVNHRHPLVGYELREVGVVDRKSTRLNSSHANIWYAVFCLKKKKQFQRVILQ